MERIIQGDCLEVLKSLPDNSVHCCVTSPPYWGLRDYGVNGQLGLEKTPEEYVEKMVDVFREVRRVLRDDGTLWLNLGDSYSSGSSGRNDGGMPQKGRGWAEYNYDHGKKHVRKVPDGLKPKDLVGIPWRVAFALQADGWYLRSDIIWHKPNAMPESVKDRPTKAHEYIFLLSKSTRYYYEADAIREPYADDSLARVKRGIGRHKWFDNGPGNQSIAKTLEKACSHPKGRNKRTVWSVSTKPFKGAHFAVFPPDLIEPCILAGSPEKACPHCGAPWERKKEIVKSWREDAATNEYQFGGWKPTCQCENNDGSGKGIVLDPFFGAGTTGLVARKHGRGFIGIELNPEYIELAKARVAT